MKPLPLFLAALALSVPLVQAKVYDITLTNATTYTQCQVKFKGRTTKFVGKDRNGKLQTVEVPSSRILNMREVEEETAAPEPTPEPEQNKPQPAEAPSAETTRDAAESPAPQPEESTPEQQAQPAPAAPETTEAPADNVQAQDATLRLREKLAAADSEYAALRAPSKSLERRMASTRQRIVKSLDKLDQQALRVAELQQQFNAAGRGEFAFTLVSEEQRTQYERDGKAAHNAMVVDMKEKPGARKVGGIDKFELMRERYQGIPEYREAYAWYLRTLHSLDAKWTKMLDYEQKRRKSTQPAKKIAMEEADRRELEKLRQSFQKEGEDIAVVWFNPRPRNIEMLKLAHNKVRDALRRNEGVELEEAVGTVPELLHQFWKVMDEARSLTLGGQLDQAESLLKDDASYDKLRRLNTSIFPKDYRDPIMEQRKLLEEEIRKRKRNVRSSMTQLEREASQLQRATGSAEAQINALLEEIHREKNLDTGENTADMETSLNEPEEEPEGEEPESKGDADAAPAKE